MCRTCIIPNRENLFTETSLETQRELPNVPDGRNVSSCIMLCPHTVNRTPINENPTPITHCKQKFSWNLGGLLYYSKLTGHWPSWGQATTVNRIKEPHSAPCVTKHCHGWEYYTSAAGQVMREAEDATRVAAPAALLWAWGSPPMARWSLMPASPARRRASTYTQPHEANGCSVSPTRWRSAGRLNSMLPGTHTKCLPHQPACIESTCMRCCQNLGNVQSCL